MARKRKTTAEQNGQQETQQETKRKTTTIAGTTASEIERRKRISGAYRSSQAQAAGQGATGSTARQQGMADRAAAQTRRNATGGGYLGRMSNNEISRRKRKADFNRWLDSVRENREIEKQNRELEQRISNLRTTVNAVRDYENKSQMGLAKPSALGLPYRGRMTVPMPAAGSGTTASGKDGTTAAEKDGTEEKRGRGTKPLPPVGAGMMTGMKARTEGTGSGLWTPGVSGLAASRTGSLPTAGAAGNGTKAKSGKNTEKKESVLRLWTPGASELAAGRSGSLPTAGAGGNEGKQPEAEAQEIRFGFAMDDEARELIRNGFSDYLNGLSRIRRQKQEQRDRDVLNGTVDLNGNVNEIFDAEKLTEQNTRNVYGIEQGRFNNGQDVTKMNDEGLSRYLYAARSEKQMLERERDAIDKELNADWDEYESYSNSIGPGLRMEVENAKGIIAGSGDDRQKEEAWGKLLESYRAIYDTWYGEGAYRDDTDGMGRRELEEFNRREIDERLNHTPMSEEERKEKEKEARTLDSLIRSVSDEIEKGERQQQLRKDYRTTIETYGSETGTGEYRPENDVSEYKYDFWTDANGGRQWDVYRPSADILYSFINHGEAWDEYMGATDGHLRATGEFRDAAYMTPKETEIFNRYYNNGKKEEAMAFFDGLEMTLSQRRLPYETLTTRKTAHDYPVMTTALTFGATAAQPIEALINLVDGIMGGNRAKNYAGEGYAITRQKNTIRAEVPREMSKEARFLYNVAMSAGDSALNALISKGLGLTGKAARNATLALFGTQIFQNSMQQHLQESNGDFGYAFIESMLDATIETATEIWSVENLLSDPTNFLKYIGKLMVSEGSEEFVASAFGPLVKEMVGRKNEWKVRADRILREGGYTDADGNWVKVANHDEATRQALREWNHEIATSTLAGALSTGGGIFVGGAQTLQNRAEMRRVGRNVLGYQESFRMNEDRAAGETAAEAAQEEGEGESMLEEGRRRLGEREDEFLRREQERKEGREAEGQQEPGTETEEEENEGESMLEEGRRRLGEREDEFLRRERERQEGREAEEQQEPGGEEQDRGGETEEEIQHREREETAERENEEDGETEEEDGEAGTEERQDSMPGMTEQGRRNLEKLIETAEQMPEDSETAKKLKKIRDRMSRGRKVSSVLVGDLAVSVVRESDAQVTEATERTIAEGAEEALKGAEVSDQQAKALAAIVSKALVHGESSLSAEEAETLRTSRSGMALYTALTERSTETADAILRTAEENTAEAVNRRDTVISMTQNQEQATGSREAAGNRRNQPARTRTRARDAGTEGENAGTQMATEDDIRRAEGERTDEPGEIIVDGRFGRLGNAAGTVIAVRQKNESGEDSLGFTVTVDGQERTVSASQIKTMDFGTAAIVREAATNPRFYSAGFTNALLQAQRMGTVQNAGQFLAEATRIRIAGYTGMKMPTTGMPRQVADILYSQSRDEHAQNRKEQTADGQRNAGRPGTGRSTLNGTEYGTDAWNEQIKQLNISRKTRNQMEAAAEFAKRAGIELTFVDNAEVARQGAEGSRQRANPETIYGWENGQGITVNVEGLDFGVIGEEGATPTGEHHILVTLGHEMTHWLQRNSLEGYNRLENFVMTELSRNGANRLSARVQEVMEQRGLNLEDAISEIVADSCDQILANEDVARHIEETDRTLFGEIRGFVRDLVQRVKEAVTGMDMSRSRDAEGMIRYANRLAKVWLGAYDEAISERLTETENSTEGRESTNEERFSVPYTKTEATDLQKNKKIVIFDGKYKTFKQFVKEGKKPAHTFKKMYFGKVDYNLARRIEAISGLKIDGYNITLANDEVRKIAVISHGNPVAEAKLGQVQITARELYDAITVIEAADNIEPDSTDYIGNPIFNFKKDINGIQTVAAYVAKGTKDLRIQTTYKRKPSKANKKGSLATAGGVTSPSLTPKTTRRTASNNTITQNTNNSNRKSEADMNAAYEEAVKRGDIAAAEGMLLQKAEGTPGIIPYIAATNYGGVNKTIAMRLKTGDREAVRIAAEAMARKVPGNAVLIPMPPHGGTVTEETDTMILAREISRLTGRPVMAALEGAERERRFRAGTDGNRSVKAAQMGFRQVMEIPEDAMPVFIDNVVAGGETAKAAHDAVGRGFTLSYAGASRGATLGLKNAGVTREKGQLIPYSQRMDIENRNRRYSEAEAWNADRETSERMSRDDEGRANAQSWMAGLTPGSLQTEDERELLQAFKDLRMKISLSVRRQLDYKAKIRSLENAGTMTPEEAKDLDTLRAKLAEQQDRQAELEKKLYRVTSSEGYAGMMYRHYTMPTDFLYGRTQDEVNRTVNDLVKQVQAAGEALEKQAEQLRRMEQSEAGKAAKAFYQSQYMKGLARNYKKQFASSMGTEEIAGRLALLFTMWGDRQADVASLSELRTAERFADVAQEAESLVTDLLRTSRNSYDLTGELAEMRGLQLTISRNTLNELKSEGNYRSIKDIRAALRGSGVRVVLTDSTNLLETDEIESLVPGIQAVLYDVNGERITANTDLVTGFIDHVQNLMRQEQDLRLHEADVDAAVEEMLATAAAQNSYRKTAGRGNTAEAGLMQGIRELIRNTGRSAEEIGRIRARLREATEAGEKAQGLTRVLQQDVRSALDYYNKVAGSAARESRMKVKEELIKQLRSDHAKALVAQEQKFRDQMKHDRRLRELAEDNRHIRSTIDTLARRLNRLITAETDQKNVPEQAKPLARQLLRMLGEHDFNGYRRVLHANRAQLAEMMRILDSYEQRDGAFDPENDLKWLVVAEGTEHADTEARDRVMQDLIDIEQGLLEYRTAEGHGIISIQDRKTALSKVQKAMGEICDVIRAARETEINGRRMLINELAIQAQDDMKNSRFRGEWQGLTRAIGTLKGAVVYGNMTPEYFFKNLRNRTISQLFNEYHRAENRFGLEAGRAREFFTRVAEETGFEAWDLKTRREFRLANGGTVRLTLGEMMSLYATWQRETMNQADLNGPERSFHLELGGFYVEEESRKAAGREIVRKRAHRVNQADVDMIRDAMTPEQLNYVNQVVGYLSNEMSELGNEASMRMFGIRKYSEKFYFPFEIWNGQKAVKSSSGTGGNTENRAAHSSFTRRRINNARNALMIRDFTQVASKHVQQMIIYSTFAPAIETMQRVMNTKLTVGEGDDTTTRNLRTAFGEAYGREALNYFDNFQQDINGGATLADRTLWDRLLSVHRKSAVAGSLSVSLQQPLSYIRAAVMINPKYLATSVNIGPRLKAIREEMEQYSGVAVIKRMGKFDMGMGRSAIDYITPKGKTGTVRTAYEWIGDKATALPMLMDTWTWCNMWEAVKKEQTAAHQGMDTRSEEFLNIVAERFNEVMRLTQVYDSVLVRSRNMRSRNPVTKGLTSFMAEPTLTANVLADAIANMKEKGGARRLRLAAATYVVSAVMQAVVKGLMSAGRTPDERKTFIENFAFRFMSMLMSELDPLSLIPGYRGLYDTLKGEDITDDAMAVPGKILGSVEKGAELIAGKSGDVYRSVEDSVGMLTQLFTMVPVKNLMRDARAIYNWATGSKYAGRPTSGAVLRYQTEGVIATADNLIGVLNQYLGDQGTETKNTAYYRRILEAEKAGDTKTAEELTEWLTLGKGVKEDSIRKGVNAQARKDSGMSEEEKAEYLIGNDGNGAQYVMDQFRDGKIGEDEAMRLLKKAEPEKTGDEIWWKIDRVKYQKENGRTVSGYYYRLEDAVNANRAEDIRAAVAELMGHGVSGKQIVQKLSSWKSAYQEADADGRIRIRDAVTKAYKAAGYTAADAEKKINGWMKKGK